MTGNGAEEGQVELELCQLCNRSDLALDKLYRDRENRICAHSHCLLFSSGLQQDGDEDDQDQEEGEGGKGIQGFLPHHIKEELKRGYKLRCSYCGKRGATVGCAKPTCKRSYHLPCGIENQTTQQHFGQFKSFCPQHQPRPKVKPCPSQTDAKSISGRCAFCPEEVVLPLNSGSFSSLLTPCCQALLHRSCAQDSAVSLGYYHFECPACKNLTTYRSEMRRLGIYVPVPDNKVRGLVIRPLPNICIATEHLNNQID